MKKLLLPLMIISLVGLAFGQTVDFDTQIQPIFNTNCVGCHTASHSTGLNLTSGNSYDLLVDHVSANYSPALRVVSGDASASVLYNKVANTGVNGGLMPQGGPQLSAGDIALIQTWINELGMVTPISIAEARTHTVGDIVTIGGIVITGNYATAGSSTDYHIQDGTAGSDIYLSGTDAGLALGDSIIVTGTITIFAGKFEVIPASADDITVVSSGNALPAFQVVTIAEFLASFADYSSELIEFDSVTITSGNWPSAGSNGSVTISDGTGSTTLYIDKDTNLDENTAPTSAFNIKGIGTQYNTTAEILPRFYSDILVLGSIADARTHASGETVTVTGIVTSPNFGTAGSYTELAIQDPTGGLVIFSNTFDSGLSIGDIITVTGTISIYSGTIELVPSSPAAITLVSSGNTLPAFQLVDLANFMANYNDYESELIVIDSVSIIGGVWPSPGGNANITITDPTGTISTLRIDKDSDLDENSQPLGYFILQGLGGDFNAGQVKPRFYSDIQVIGDPPPAITNVTHFPASPTPADAVLVSATIQDNGSVEVAEMVYTVNAGTETTISMTASAAVYSATIPAQDASAVVEYWVSATDDIGGTSVSTPGSYVVYSGNVNTIASIQDGTIPTGTTVTIQGIVTAESWGFDAPGSLSHFYIQDDEAAYSGVKVYQSGVEVAQGDEVRLTGVVDEYFGCTEIINLDSMEILSHKHRVNPVVVPLTTTDWEPYEGVLITVENVTVSNPDLGFGEWSVTDGTNTLVLDDDAKYYYYPVQDEALASITGVLDYSFNVYKLEPRLTNDIATADGLTSIQAFQQVRYSDLFPREQIDGNLHVSDSSYMYRDTLTIRGIVTMPTGLSYAGAGIKFLFQDVNGGPWSSVMSYDPDSSAFPVLFEGDLIEATGYVEEYTTDRSAMTEFFITREVELIDVGLTPPTPPVIPTGDLRWPTTAEQWGTGMVTVENVTITDDVPIFELFAVDDGSGSVLIDDDSDSLTNYITPPPGTEFSSITGWVYNHYGYYEDSTAYKLEPLYEGDLVLLNAVGDEPVVPAGYALSNYPNPFNPTTTIAYRIPEASPVKLVVYDQLGRIVKVVANGYQTAGEYKATWDGTNNYGQKVSSGVYFYRLVAGQHDMVGKMVMLK